MLGIGPLEYLRSLGDEFDELAADLHVGAFSVLMAGQVAGQLAALLLQHVEPLPEEVFGDQPVKAIVDCDPQDSIVADRSADVAERQHGLKDLPEERAVCNGAAPPVVQIEGKDGILVEGSREDSDGRSRKPARQHPDLGVHFPDGTIPHAGLAVQLRPFGLGSGFDLVREEAPHSGGHVRESWLEPLSCAFGPAWPRKVDS